jgi:hypothetical protein
MRDIEPPRPADQAVRTIARREVTTEPSTARALWPTFMRRTLEEEKVRPACPDAARTA